MPDDQATDDHPAEKKKFWRQLLVIVVAVIAVTLLVKAFVLQPYRIPSQSMENTLLPGERILVNRLAYHFRGIARGDIVVFSGNGSWGNLDGRPATRPSSPVVRVLDDALSDIGLYSNQTFYIKRVIGLPGDHVACCSDGRVTVNGVPLEETSYLFPGSAPSVRPFSVIVPAGRLWVMGDNREDSDDSLDHMLEGYPDQGTVPRARWPAGRSRSSGRCRGSATCPFPPRSSRLPWSRAMGEIADRKLVRYWDKHASRYDQEIEFWDRHLFGGSRPWAAGRAVGEVLEVAIGTGRNLPYYPDGISLTGVDMSTQMLALARDRARDLGRQADLRPGDAQRLEFPDSSFDTVLCTLGLCAIPDDRRAIGEMARVLRPGGRLVLVDHIAARPVLLRLAQWLYERITIPLAGEHFRRRPLAGCANSDSASSRPSGSGSASSSAWWPRNRARPASPLPPCYPACA